MLLNRCCNVDEIEVVVTVVLEAIQEIITQDEIIIIVTILVQEVMIDLDIDIILHLQVVVEVKVAIQEISSFLLIDYSYIMLFVIVIVYFSMLGPPYVIRVIPRLCSYQIKNGGESR